LGSQLDLLSKSQQVETLVTMEADLDRGVPWCKRELFASEENDHFPYQMTQI